MTVFSFRNLGLSLGALLLANTPVCAQTNGIFDYDNKSAVIFAYFSVGNDDTPNASITREQFVDQINEIRQKSYTVKSLPDIISAFEKNKTLPPRTIALTFDGADQSILNNAIPVLEQYKLPYTIFIPSDKVTSNKPPFMTWDDLRSLRKSNLASFGIHPSSYSRLSNSSAEEIKRQLNGSLSKIREELDLEAPYLAYPFGDYNELYKRIAHDMGFKAAFGQQSGVSYAGDDRYALPRFTITERYGDMDRFRMTANALPFPVTDLSPSDPHLDTLNPAIGFTLPDPGSKSIKGSLSCFSSGEGKPKLEFIGPNRVEIRLSSPIFEDRPRINCTLPVAPASDEEQPRWRWFGMLYSVKSDLIENVIQPSENVAVTDGPGGLE